MSIEDKNPEITKSISDNSVEKSELSDSSVERNNESVDKSNIGAVALKNAEVKIEPEKNIGVDRNRFGYSLIGCYEACKIKDLLYTQKEYISVDDVRDFVKTYSQDGVGRLCGLLQFEENIANRVDSEQKVDAAKRLKFEELKRVKNFVNSEYIVDVNKKIYKYIHNIKSPEKNNFKMFRNFLAVQMDIASSNSKDINNELSLFDLRKEDYDTKMIFDAVNGMRHEAAFRDLLKEIPDVIDFRDSTNLEDSKGVDLIVKAKISNKMNDFGYYDYATPDEIASDDFKILELPIDVKSTKRRAEEALLREVNSGYKLDHWVMWSNIYPEDFLLDIDDKNRVKYYKNIDKATLLLNKEKQIAAMERLGGIQYERTNGEMLRPASLEKRLRRIKDEVLNGINKFYIDEQYKAGASI